MYDDFKLETYFSIQVMLVGTDIGIDNADFSLLLY
jgi:hypothetical protein